MQALVTDSQKILGAVIGLRKRSTAAKSTAMKIGTFLPMISKQYPAIGVKITPHIIAVNRIFDVTRP